MTGPTHIIGGVLFAQGAYYILQKQGIPAVTAELFISAVAGALLPDIDHPQSKISNSSTAAKATSYAVSIFTGHRGITHTPVFIALAAAGVYALLPHISIMTITSVYGIIAGMLSHLILDTLNPGGIPWFWPLSAHRLHLMRIPTRSLREALFSLSLTVLCSAAYLQLFTK